MFETFLSHFGVAIGNEKQGFVIFPCQKGSEGFPRLFPDSNSDGAYGPYGAFRLKYFDLKTPANSIIVAMEVQFFEKFGSRFQIFKMHLGGCLNLFESY